MTLFKTRNSFHFVLIVMICLTLSQASPSFAQLYCQSLFEKDSATETMEKLILIEDELKTLDTQVLTYSESKAADSKAKEELLSQMSSHHILFESLAEHLFEREVGDYQNPMNELRRDLQRTRQYLRFLTQRFEIHNIMELIEEPQMILSNYEYLVPQAYSISGKPSSQKMSVRFSEETAEFIKSDVAGGARFLRSILKGYVPAGSGSGIVRITDQHENLIEIKTIGGREGNTRLIGCRGAAGSITILKVYEKKNEGGGGSLKKFSLLCG